MSDVGQRQKSETPQKHKSVKEKNELSHFGCRKLYAAAAVEGAVVALKMHLPPPVPRGKGRD